VEPHVPDILKVIQLVVAPVFLLTAVGTLINALNSRLGRAVDRRRVLEQLLHSLSEDQARTASAELARVHQRIHVVYLAIFAAVISALFVCLLIGVAFVGGFMVADPSRTVAILFVMSMVALIASLLLFMREIYLAVSTPRHV
jgi:hypothetical protein